MATAVAADTFAETAAQTKRENNDEKSIPEEVEIVLDKLAASEENKKVEINNPHDEEASKVLDKDDDDGGILKGESEGKTSHSEDTNDGTTLLEKKSDTNEKTLSEEVERGLDKLLATEENNPHEGCDGTAEGEKITELSSTDKAITEGNYGSAEYSGKPCSKTENETQENLFSLGEDSEGKDFGIIMNKGIPPYVSQEEAEEPPKDDDDDGGMTPEETSSVQGDLSEKLNEDGESGEVCNENVSTENVLISETSCPKDDSSTTNIQGTEEAKEQDKFFVPEGMTTDKLVLEPCDDDKVEEEHCLTETSIIAQAAVTEGTGLIKAGSSEVDPAPPKEKVGDSITEHEQNLTKEFEEQSLTEAPRELHLGDDETVGVCATVISEVKLQDKAKMFKDGADSKISSRENEAEMSLNAAQEEIEGSGIQQNMEPTAFSKELISNKSNEGVLKGESEEKTSHSEDTNDGTTLQERLHEEMGTLTDIVGGTSENKRENDEMQPVEPEVVFDKQAPEETSIVEIDNPLESLKNNENANDGTAEVEKAVEIPSVATAIEEPNSSAEPIENPINTTVEVLPVEPEVVLDKQAPEETNTVEIDNPRESLKNNEDGNDGTVEVEKAVELPSAAKAIEEANSSPEPIENPINTEDEMLPVEPEVVLDKQAPEETNTIEIDNPRESLKNNEDGNDGTVEVEKAVELPSVANIIEEPNSSAEPIEKPTNTEDEMLPFEPEVVLDKQVPEENNMVKIDNPHESLKNNEDGNDGTAEVEKEVELPSVAKVIEEPNSPAEPIENPINTEDEIPEKLSSEVLNKDEGEGTTQESSVQADAILNCAADLTRSSEEASKVSDKDDDGGILKGESEGKTTHSEDTKDGPTLQEKKRDTNEKKTLSEEVERGLDKLLATEENNPQEGCDGTAEGEKITELSSTDKAITEENYGSAEYSGKLCGKTENETQENMEQQNMEPTAFSKELISNKSNEGVLKGESEEKTSHSEDTNDGTTLQERQLHEEMGTLTDIVGGTSENKRENDEMQPVEPEVVFDKQAPEETSIVEIDNPLESLKNNEDANEGTVEVEKAVEIPSVAMAIEEPNSSAEPIENPINTTVEVLPVEPEVVLDKQAPEETNTVEIDNPRESLKNNEDGNDGTVEVEKAVELPSAAKAIEEPNNSPEPIENPINTEDEMLPVEPEVALDKQAPEETNTVEIDNPREYLKNNEDGNDGTIEVGKAVELPSAAKAIEEPNSSPEPIEKPINTEDEMLPFEPEVVLDKQVPEETNVVEIDNPHESLKNNDGNDGTAEVEKEVEVPSVGKAIEEPNCPAEAIEKPINTEDEIPEKLSSEGENRGGQDVGVLLTMGIPPNESKHKAEEPSEVLNKDEGEGMTQEPLVQADAILNCAADLTSSKEGEKSDVYKENDSAQNNLATKTSLPEDDSSETNFQRMEEKEQNKVFIPDGKNMDPFVVESCDDKEHEGTLNEVETEDVQGVNYLLGSQSVASEIKETNLDEAVPVIPKPFADSAQVSEAVLQVDINTNDNDDNHQSKISEKDMVDGSLPQENHKEKLSDMTTEHDKPTSMEAPRGLHTDDNNGIALHEKQLHEEMATIADIAEGTSENPHEEMGTLTDILGGISEHKRENDETQPVEPKVVLDKQAPEETNIVEIDNPLESLKNNEDGNHGAAEVEKAVELPSVAKDIEEPNSSAEPIEKPINTEDEMLPVEPEVVLDKQAPEETNMVEIDNPCESLKNNEDGNDGTVEVEKVVDSVAKAIEEPNSSVEPTEKPINTEDEMQPVGIAVVLDKQTTEETNTVEIDNPRESLKNNEDGNDGTVEVEKPFELPSVAKAIEEPNSSVEPIEKPINTEDEMLPVESEVVLDKQAPEETNTVEIDNPCESLINNEDGNDGTVEVEKAVELPSAAKAIEEPNSSAEPIENPINTKDEMLPVEPEVVLDKQAPEETNTVEIDNPCESLKNNEDGNDGTVEVEKAVELPSAAKAIEEPNSSAEPIENPINTEDEMLPVEPEVVLDKQAPEETNTVEIDNPCESLKNNDDGNDGTVEVEKAVELPSAAKAIEEPNCSAEPIENPINTDDEILPVQPEVVLDKQAPEETNMVEIDNPCESLKTNEDGNDGTVEVEKAIEQPNSSVEPIEKPINTDYEMLPIEPEVVLDKQAPEETNTVEIDNPHEFLKKNEDGNDGTIKVEKAADLPSAAEAIEEPNSSPGESEDKFSHPENINDGIALHEKQLHEEMATIADIAEGTSETTRENDEMQPVEPDVMLDKQAPEETNIVEIDNPCESLKNKEDGNDGAAEIEMAVELPSDAKAIEEPSSSAEPIENPINTENEILPVQPEVVLDKQAPEETNMVEIDNRCESLKNNEDGNDGTVEVEKVVDSVAKAIEEPDSSVEPTEKQINTEDEIQPVEIEVVLDKQTPEETKTVEIDNPRESLKNNEDANDGTVEVEKAVELPSVAKAIEEPNSSVEPIEKPINTEDEMLPVEPEVVLDKQAPEETNTVEIDNPREYLKNNEDGNDGTIEVEEAVELPSAAKAIEEPKSSPEPIENPINTEDEMLPVEREVVLDKQAPEETSTVEIDNPCESLKNNEDGNDGTVEVEKAVELPSAAKAIEEPNSSAEPIENPINTDDEILPVQPEVVLDKQAPEETNMVEIDNLCESLKNNEDGNDGTVEVEKTIEEPNSSVEPIEKPINTEDEMLPIEPEVVLGKQAPEETNTVEVDNPYEFLKKDEDGNDGTVKVEQAVDLPSSAKVIKELNSSPGESEDKFSHSENKNDGIALHEKQLHEEMATIADIAEGTRETNPESVRASFDKIEGETVKEEAFSEDNKKDQICTQIEHQITRNDMETENAHGVDDLLGSQLVASEITETTLDEAAPITPEPADSAPPSEVFTTDLQGEINTSDNDYSNQSKILEQDTIVDGNLSTACKAQENPEEKLSDLITEHEGNLPKESEGPVSTEASRGLHTDENETTAVCEVTSQMKQQGIPEMVKDDAAQEEIERSCLQQNIEPTTFSKELISEQSNEGILEGEDEDKSSHSQITDEGITLQEKQLHEEVATIADIAEGTSETKIENDEKTLPDKYEVMLDKLAPDESKKVEIGNPHEISKSNEEGSDETVECEKMIELPSAAKDTIEENNRSTEPAENPSNTEDEQPGKLFSEGESREGRDTGTILNREIPPNESQPEAEEPSKALEKDDDAGMTPEKTFVQADAVINCPADFTENLKEDREKSGEVCNENDSTQHILATKTSLPNDDSNGTNAQGIEDKEQDKDFIPEGENMDSLVVESPDDKEDGKVKKEESLAETCKIPLMEIQSQSSDSQDAHNVIGSPLSTSPTEETSSEKVGSSEVEPESTKASSDTMEDEFVKQEIFSNGSSSCQISSQMEHNIEHDEVETETIQGVNDLLRSQLVSPEIKETGSGEGTSVSETTADPTPLIEVHGTVLEDGVHMNENKEDHQCKIIEKDNIVDDSVTVQEENITRAGEEQTSEEELRGLHGDENETVAVYDVISEVEQQDTDELSKDDVDSKDSLFKYESEKENLHAPCEETEKAALPQNADQTAFNEELISVKDDEVLRGESEDKAAYSDNNGETNPQETNMLTVDLDETKSIQRNENSAWANDSTVDEKPEEQIYTATDMPTQELKYAYEANKMPEIKVLGDTSVQGQPDLGLISACPADIHVAEDTVENSNEMCLEEVADMENQEDQIKQDSSQSAASEVRGNLSKGIENEISKDCVCSNTIIDKVESLNSSIPTGEAKESKEEIKEPVKEANYHNFQTTHADTEEQVICVLTNAQNTMQSEEKMLPKEKECHVQNFSVLKTSEENEEQISETGEPLTAATGEMETELVEVQGKIAPVSSGLASEKDVVTGNENEVDTDERDTVPNQENDSSLNRKVNVETVAAGEDTDTREMSLHEEQIEACLSITDDKVASSLEEENPITKIVNETTIAETSSPLGTREGMVTKEILLEEEQHSVINSEGRSLNDLEEEKLELNEKSLEHRTEDFMINSSDSTTKVHPKSVQPDEELIPSSQSVAEEGDESITSDGALTSSAEDACPQKVTTTSFKPESIVLEKTQVGSRNEEIKEECTTAEDSKMKPQECTSGEKTFYTQSVENDESVEVGTTETSKDEDSKMFQDKLVPENSNVEPKNLDASYSTDKEIQGAGMEEACIETSELDSEKSDHIIESASEVHKLEMLLEAKKIGFVEENLAKTEIEEIVIKETNEENDIIKADISSEQTQIADQSVIVKSSLDYSKEVLSQSAYQEVELKPEENELERLGENESIKEEASSDNKAGAESSEAQDSKALHAIETAVAEESHDGNGREISAMPMLQEQVKHSIAVEKQNEEQLQSIVDGADTEKTLEDEKLDSCTEVQEGITGEADRSKKTESSTPSVSECVQLTQQEPVLIAVQPEIQELETEKVSGAPSETEVNQPKTNEMSTNTSEETSHEHGHDEIQSDIITSSQVLAHFKDSDITEEECPLDLKVIKIEQDKCSASESCKAVPTEAILNISTEGSASRAEKNQCTKPELQEENAIKSLTQGPGETTMETAKDGETEVQQKNLDFSFNIKDSAMENSSTETEQKDVQDNIDTIESAQEHVPGHPYELQNDEADPTKIQNDNSTDSEEKGSKNEAAGLECGEDAKTEVEVNKVTDGSQTMESSTLSDSNLMLRSIEESSQVTEHEDTKSQTEKLCDFTHNKDSEMAQPREFPCDFTEIKNYIDDKLAQHESMVAVLDTEFPSEADPHENTEVRPTSEDNDSQEMQQNSEATTTHNDLEEMKPENAGETKHNFEGLVSQEEKRTVDHCREKLDTSLTQSTILQESIEQILKPKLEAENKEQIKSMQEEEETKNMETVDPKDNVQSMQEKETVVLSAPRKDGEDPKESTYENISNNNINASQPQDKSEEETKERRTATEARDEPSMADLPRASLNEREKESKAETEQHEEARSDQEEEEGGEHKGEDPVIVENAAGDADVKAGKKKHHNILSGVGSKVKHSIAKVKKVITGKSSPTKQQSPK